MTELTLSWAGCRRTAHPGDLLLLGRDETCDVVVGGPETSRRHARVAWRAGSWVLADLSSANGTEVNGREVSETILRDGDVIALGSDEAVVQVAVVRERRQLPPGDLDPDTRSVGIGRGTASELCLPDLLVSRQHARLDVGPQGAVLTDLDSFNGTFLNGIQIDQAVIHPGDVINVGRTTLCTLPDLSLAILSVGEPASLAVSELSFRLPDGRTLLDGISFEVPAGSLTAVIGPSGAGKSTLFSCITSQRQPSSGAVTYAGTDLHRNLDSLRHQIGVVPQEDIVHRSLTVHQVLTYAAALRFPDDVSSTDRATRVAATAEELGLSEHLNTRVDRLSGGQRKRTSVAMELLTQPSLLLLDEPTSGLDPGLDQSVMRLLRDLADAGRTVLVVTHSTENLDVCDNVLVLATGGRVAYFGPPSQLLSHFGAQRMSSVFDKLDGSVLQVPRPPSGAQHVGPSASPDTSVTPPVGLSNQPRRQLDTLIKRQLRLVLADRSYAVFTLALPVALAVLASVVPGSAGLGGAEPPSAEAGQLLVVLVVGVVFMGMSATVRDVVAERPIFERERAVGLAPSVYLASKLAVFAAVALVQCTVLVTLTLLIKTGPAEAVLLGSPAVELILILFLTTWACAALGLLISTFATTSEQTMPLLVVTFMVQLVLCGGVIPVAGRALLEQLSWLTPARWGYAGAASIVDLNALSPGRAEDALWLSEGWSYLRAAAALLVLGALASWVALRRLHGRGRPGGRR